MDCFWCCRASGNPGRGYDEKVDFAAALKDHFDSNEAITKIKQTVDLLTNNKGSKKLSTEEKLERGWDEAYDLRPWHEYPDTERVNATGVVLQNLTGGWFGNGGGPTLENLDFASKLRKTVQNVSDDSA